MVVDLAVCHMPDEALTLTYLTNPTFFMNKRETFCRNDALHFKKIFVHMRF